MVETIIDYDFILKFVGVLSGSIGVLRFMDYHYKKKLKSDTDKATNTIDIGHLEDQLATLSKELASSKDEMLKRFCRHEEFADQAIREIKVDMLKLTRDLAYFSGAFRTYQELHEKK